MKREGEPKGSEIQEEFCRGRLGEMEVREGKF